MSNLYPLYFKASQKSEDNLKKIKDIVEEMGYNFKGKENDFITFSFIPKDFSELPLKNTEAEEIIDKIMFMCKIQGITVSLTALYSNSSGTVKRYFSSNY